MQTALKVSNYDTNKHLKILTVILIGIQKNLFKDGLNSKFIGK